MSDENTTGRLKDRVALIIGGGQAPGETIGNGRATTLTFAREGAKLAIVDRILASAEETVRMVSDKYGADAFAIQGDVTNEDDCARFASKTIDRFGRIDILHNNVGVATDDAGPLTVTLDAWRKVFDINLTGMFSVIKQVLPIMQAQRSGSIINISSIISISSDTEIYARDGYAPRDESGIIAYRVSKSGVNSLTESLASSQAGFGIRVNAILPGLMQTPNAVESIMEASNRSRADVNAVRDAQVPLGEKQGSAWDIANAALFLASDEARFITGVLLPVDGGQTLKRG
ncbi:MAG: SDR family oxidoreductase [Rhodospirillales bacterium]|nr:SDR family oxidoreductase [Rhodospirillales bacterium]